MTGIAGMYYVRLKMFWQIREGKLAWQLLELYLVCTLLLVRAGQNILHEPFFFAQKCRFRWNSFCESGQIHRIVSVKPLPPALPYQNVSSQHFVNENVF